FQIEVLQNIQDLRHVHAAGAGRRKADNRVPAIGRNQRFAQLDLVILEILRRQNTAVLFHPFRGGLREGSAVKPIGPLLRYMPISRGEVRLLEEISLAQGLTIAKKDRVCRIEPGHVPGDTLEAMSVSGIEQEYVFG